MTTPRVGQVPDLSTLGAGLMYVKLATPIGVAVVDPFASAQDPTTSAIIQRLGIHMTIGFGPAPAPEPGETSLLSNLSVLGTLAAGAVAYLLRPKLSTVAVVAGAALLVNSGALTRFFASASPAAAATA